MRIAISATGNDLDSPFSQLFGRCPTFVVVDSDAITFQAVPNQGLTSAGGAGIQAAQQVVDLGVKAVVTGSVGPNAYQVLAAAHLPVYTFDGATVREALEAYKAGRLSVASEATGPAHVGMGVMGGMGHGHGMGGRGRRGGRG